MHVKQYVLDSVPTDYNPAIQFATKQLGETQHKVLPRIRAVVARECNLEMLHARTQYIVIYPCSDTALPQ